MSQPRPVRALPGAVTEETEQGALAAEVARIVIVTTIVLGQLWAITVALEAYLLDEVAQAWWLAGFSVASFVVALWLTVVRPRRGTGRTPPPPPGPHGRGTYRATPARPRRPGDAIDSRGNPHAGDRSG